MRFGNLFQFCYKHFNMLTAVVTFNWMEDGYIPKMYFSTFICVKYMMKDILLKGINPLQLNSSLTHPMKKRYNISRIIFYKLWVTSISPTTSKNNPSTCSNPSLSVESTKDNTLSHCGFSASWSCILSTTEFITFQTIDNC